jgi:hypothetical protein
VLNDECTDCMHTVSGLTPKLSDKDLRVGLPRDRRG